MRQLLRTAAMALAVAVGTAATPAMAAASTPAVSRLPNPCFLLAKLHPEKTLTKGRHVHTKLGKQKTYGTENLADHQCSETVGKLTVVVDVSENFGGFGGVLITSVTHPNGLGKGDELVVGKALGTHKPIDFIVFHKGATYVDLSADGASPAALTALARQAYTKIA